METILNLLDYNYDTYVLYACVIGLLAFIAYSIFKLNPDKNKIIRYITYGLVIVSFGYIAGGALTYLTSPVDVEANYKTQNDSLFKVNDSLKLTNDSLYKVIAMNQINIDKSNNKLKEYQTIINNTKLDFNEKIISIDNSNSDDIDSFFTGYSTRYYEIYTKN